MKHIGIQVLLASLLLIAHPSFAQSLPDSGRNLILAEGTAEVTGQNDSAKISVAVVTEGLNLEQASTENARKTKAVLNAIKGLKIKNFKLKTSGYRVTPRKDYKARPPKIKGYEVHNGIEAVMEGFESDQLSRHVSSIVEKALESGANTIQHLQFYIKNMKPLETQALTQATQDAMDRAKTLAAAAGVKLKRLTLLSTHPIDMPPRPQLLQAAEMRAEASTVAPPIETGEGQIRVRVSIAYEIE